MKVLMQIRPDFQRNPAGDSVQMISTANELKKLGVEITISSDPNLLLTPYDIVHIFNITRVRESYMYFLNAQKQKKKVVVSPIYWDPTSYLHRKEAGPNDYAAWKLAQPMRARIVRECDLLLPNGEIEGENLHRDFPKAVPFQVIPNGFPNEFAGVGPELFRERFNNLPEEFILSVARLSPRKNQDWLARICQELDLPLVLVGPVNDRRYFEIIRSFSKVVYLGTLQGDMLASAYAAAKVHALCSWFETPGLSNLEAAACGTVVLSTDQGSTQEYFKDLAVYVHPKDDESLHTGLTQALTWSPEPLTKHVQANYSWSEVARSTLEIYKSVLNK